MKKRILFAGSVLGLVAACGVPQTTEAPDFLDISDPHRLDFVKPGDVQPAAPGGGGGAPAAATCRYPKWLTTVASADATSMARVDAIALNSSSQIVVGGAFIGSAQVGNLAFATADSPGRTDLFVTALDNNGAPKWVQHYGGRDNNWLYDVEVDASDNIYMTGTFAWPVTFGAQTVYTRGSVDPFFARLTSTGVPVWATSGGSPYYDFAYDLEVVGSSGIIAQGVYNTQAQFGDKVIDSVGATDAFVTRLDATGAFSWVQTAGSALDDGPRRMAVDAAGNSYITGAFTEVAEFGSASLVSSGGYDVYLAKLTSAGQFEWAISGGSNADEYGRAVGSGDGSVFIAGTVADVASFGGVSLGNSGPALYLVRVSPSGAVEWASYLGEGWFGVNALTVTADGVYITGYFGGAPVTVGSSTIVSQGDADVMVLKAGLDGSWLNAVAMGGAGSDFARDLQVEQAGNVYVVGAFSGTATFGTETRTAVGSSDGFVVQLPKQCF